MRILFVALCLLAATNVLAQDYIIKGSVKDTANTPYEGATVTVIGNAKDTFRTVSDSKGEFVFTKMPAVFTLTVEAISANTFKKQFAFETESKIINIRNIVLTAKSNVLQEVTVSTIKAITIKEDTISYKADSFAVRPNSVVEDLLKKLPGLEVDKNGNVTAQGKSVTKVKVNGKDFFGGDIKTATRELPADIVDRVDIIDDYGDQAAYTGNKDGESQKVLNLQIKKDKNNGYFGNATAAKGTVGRYAASLSGFRFSNNEQLSLITNFNNTNTDMFNFSAPGLQGGGGNGTTGGGGMGMNAGGGGPPGSGSSSSTSTSNGISDTKSVGFNYRNNLGTKITLYGSYMYTHKNTATINNTTQQNLFETGAYTTYQNSDQNTIGDNHRVALNLEYNIDSANYLKVNPAFAYRTNNSSTISATETLLASKYRTTSATSSYLSNATAPNLSGSILYNHRFKKKGRNFSLNYTGSGTTTDQDNDNDTKTYYYDTVSGNKLINQYRLTQQQNESNNWNVRLSYQEPLSKTNSLEFNYSYGKSLAANDKEVYNVDSASGKNILIDSLSNVYKNLYYTNRVGVNFRGTAKMYNYSIGMAVQPALVKSVSNSNAYSYSQFNYLPVARFSYKFSRSRSFDVNYMGRTSQPSYEQLQPVKDNSNPQSITVGNPNLKPEFANSLNIRYNNYDFARGDVFFSNLSYTLTKNKIVTDALNPTPGVQETHYLNDDGYYTLNTFYFLSKPFQNRRYVLNLNGSANYNNNVSYINSQRNIGRNWVISQSIKGTISTNTWIDLGASASYTLNSTRYTLKSQPNTTVKTMVYGSDAKFYLPKNFVISYDVQKTINKGYTSNATNPFLVNGYLEKKLFKKQNGSIKLQAFDLLDENSGLSRTVANNTITDTYSNRLGRYYLLTFAFRFSKFGGASLNGMGMPRMGPPPAGM